MIYRLFGKVSWGRCEVTWDMVMGTKACFSSDFFHPRPRFHGVNGEGMYIDAIAEASFAFKHWNVNPHAHTN